MRNFIKLIEVAVIIWVLYLYIGKKKAAKAAKRTARAQAAEAESAASAQAAEAEVSGQGE